jgi:flagellar biosynthetic protein FliO
MERSVNAALWLLQVTDAPRDIGAIGTSGWEYLKLVLVLGLILALAFLVLRVGLPLMTGVRNPVPGAIQVAARYPLEPKKNLYVIRVGEDYLLLGTTESGMHHLTALDAARVEAALAKPDTRPRTEFGTLVRALRRPKGSS